LNWGINQIRKNKEMSEYSDENLLMLSGIQHVAFCERQWALIHVEQQWSENVKTVEGHFLHEKTDDPFAGETRGDLLILRAVPLISRRLGLTGRADVVELHRTENEPFDRTIHVESKPGRWIAIPVEYKRGKPKPDECDEAQLCAQAYAIEESNNIVITKGYLYYGETRHRHEVVFSEQLRKRTEGLALRMHELFDAGKTPQPRLASHCKSCSLYNICIPGILKNSQSVSRYIKQSLDLPI
jgi:CRISPR-associated exonuclease Cas4